MRAKIAAKAMKLTGVAGCLADSTEIGGIDSKGDHAVSENIVDQQEKTMNLVLGKVKVRKEAERIHQLVSQGELAASDLDELVSFGIDPEAVKYYKEYYGQVDGGKEFASALTKEDMKAQASEEIEAFKVKIARAYSLVNEMVAKDLMPNDADSIREKVDEIVSYNDAAFDSVKRIVASAPSPVKKVASMPISGMIPPNGLFHESVQTSTVKNDYLEALQGVRSHKTSR